MEDKEGCVLFCIAAFFVFVLGLFVGDYIGTHRTIANMQKQAIAAGVATWETDAQTHEPLFKWKENKK